MELNEDVTYEEEPVEILDKKEQILRTKRIPLVKVNNFEDEIFISGGDCETHETAGPGEIESGAQTAAGLDGIAKGARTTAEPGGIAKRGTNGRWTRRNRKRGPLMRYDDEDRRIIYLRLFAELVV
ncbi:hypothetical protein CRG98_041375 [Punica granatum]|uniref:Uncharacterized protein n=1 Tax=Punica granatum TaxID=22663 RepID=A0A2I0I463_PUNGR|nr:hypothetical protein CRG98_041375 [Punica granatum]